MNAVKTVSVPVLYLNDPAKLAAYLKALSVEACLKAKCEKETKTREAVHYCGLNAYFTKPGQLISVTEEPNAPENWEYVVYLPVLKEKEIKVYSKAESVITPEKLAEVVRKIKPVVKVKQAARVKSEPAPAPLPVKAPAGRVPPVSPAPFVKPATGLLTRVK